MANGTPAEHGTGTAAERVPASPPAKGRDRRRLPRRFPLIAVGALVVVASGAAVAVVWAGSDGDVTTSPATSTTEHRDGAPTSEPGGAPSTGGTSSTAPTSLVPPPPSTAPPSGPPPAATVIWRSDPGSRVVALTFDAGSDAGHAGEILDTLAANGITATFGVTGRFAERFPQVVARVAAEGHQTVNHSYDHPSFTGFSTGDEALSREERARQLERAEAAIRAAGGGGSHGWFRPPYGDIDDGVLRDVATAGWHTLLMWTVDSLGWKGIGADAVVARCLERAEPGAIYLFHVGEEADDAAALQRIIDGLRAAGYGFAPASRLVG